MGETMRKDSWLDATASKVARSVQNPNWGEQTIVDDARIAIGVVIETLAEEAGASQIRVIGDGWDTWLDNWLRSHLDAGRDGEAG